MTDTRWEQCCEQVRDAARRRRPLRIAGGGSKSFYGRAAHGEEALRLSSLPTGVVSYEPSELSVTARAGTRLSELSGMLAEQRQMLPFDPPLFDDMATVGGAVAAGLAGSRRPWSGGVRDSVLGVCCVNGQGQVLRFGGQVMKNVAGFDVSRLMCGAMGTLGVLLEISFRLLPLPEQETGFRQRVGLRQALAGLRSPQLPLSGACHDGEWLYVRLSGTPAHIRRQAEDACYEPHPDWQDFWRGLRDHALPFFAGDTPLWRLSLPVGSVWESGADPCLCDWGGAQHWLRSDRPAAEIRGQAERAGGHATLFRGGDRTSEVFHPLSAPARALHQRVKRALDPEGILNPGVLSGGW